MRVLFFIILFFACNIYSQNTFKAVITEHDSGEPLSGVNVFIVETGSGTASDEKGYAEINGIPDGENQIRFSFIGYGEETISVRMPADNEKIFEIELEDEAEELEEISVSSTRYSRLIENTPTRVEVIAGEEIDEKISMDPSNISMLLNESTGIQVQQTSASSINNTFRIQGLDGRYTQILQDGFPLYSGFAGSLSIMQIPPLNLKQVEIIKGSSSTLYGGGAIAGLIDLVTKEPAENREISFLVNGTSAVGLDLSGYYSARSEQTGITLLASRNTQRLYDTNDDNFSDLPETERYTISPKVFNYINENSTLITGASFIHEQRSGGYIPAVRNEETGYVEENTSNRFSTQAEYISRLSSRSTLNIKNSVGYFKRETGLFDGKQLSTFTELSFHRDDDNIDWIAGLNVVSEDFNDLTSITTITEIRLPRERSYYDLVYGAFLQSVLPFSESFVMEAGMRTDYTKDYGFFALPRISLLIKWSSHFSSRIGAGLGYKIPTIFTEEAEESGYRNIHPLSKNNLDAERSYGTNIDLNYNTILFDEITFALNNLFFYTRINDPLVLSEDFSLTQPSYFFVNSPGYLDTKGIETNLKITYDHFKFFAGYSYTDAAFNLEDNVQELPLTAPHRLGLILIYEEHGNYRIGLEAYYTGRQKLSNGNTGRAYWINGLMGEKRFGRITVFLNFENFLDTRQSRFGPMYTGPVYAPQFAEIYAPTDGRIINGGIKIIL